MSVFKLLNFSYPQDLGESFTQEGSRKTKGNSQKAIWIVLSYTWFIEKKECFAAFGCYEIKTLTFSVKLSFIETTLNHLNP